MKHLYSLKKISTKRQPHWEMAEPTCVFPSFFDMTQNVLKRVLTLFRHQTSFDKKSRKNLAAFYSINACSMPARRGRPFTLVFTVIKWQKSRVWYSIDQRNLHCKKHSNPCKTSYQMIFNYGLKLDRFQWDCVIQLRFYQQHSYEMSKVEFWT